MDSSGSTSSSLSSGISEDPCKKETTSALSWGGSPKSESLPLDPVLPWSVSGLEDWLVAGWLEKPTWYHLFFLFLPDSWLSLSLHLCTVPEWALIRYILSISSSKVAVANNAFWCASHTLAKLLSSELSLSHWGSPLHCAGASGVSSSSIEGQRRAADISLRMAGSPGGELGSLCSL